MARPPIPITLTPILATTLGWVSPLGPVFLLGQALPTIGGAIVTGTAAATLTSITTTTLTGIATETPASAGTTTAFSTGPSIEAMRLTRIAVLPTSSAATGKRIARQPSPQTVLQIA